MDAACATRNLRRPVSHRTADYDYTLPEELIARYPTERRDGSRMMVLHRAERRIEHRRVSDFPDYLRAGDLAIFNNTRVIPARVFSDDRRVELLLLERVSECAWRCLVKPGRRMRMGARLQVGGTFGSVREVLEDGDRVVEFENPIDPNEVGVLPLPPYINRAVSDQDLSRYQTVYASEEGSVAAPTAGLHFTTQLLDDLAARGIGHASVTLHVGLDTFRPIASPTLDEHPMHTEWCACPPETVAAVAATRARGGRVVAIGTTAVRTLETAARSGTLAAWSGPTELFIRPGFEFRVVDCLLTNFHMPRTTLLVLVSVFASRGLIARAYEQAIRDQYRFLSYGDAMLIE